MKNKYKIFGFITACLLLVSGSLMAHVTEIRVNQNQNGSLTWYLQTYHGAFTCGIANSGININGTNYPTQYEAPGSTVGLSSTVFATLANSSGVLPYGGRVSYAVVTTPYIPGTLNVQPYSTNACWAFLVGGNGSFTPPPPPVCTSFPVTGASSNQISIDDNGTPCNPSDDNATYTINVNHLVCGDITGDGDFSVYQDPSGSNTYLGDFGYATGNTTTVTVSLQSGGSSIVRFTDNDFPGAYFDYNLGAFNGVQDNVAPSVTCPADILAYSMPHEITGNSSVSINGSGNTFYGSGPSYSFNDPLPTGATITGVDIVYNVYYPYSSAVAANDIFIAGTKVASAFPGAPVGNKNYVLSYTGGLPSYNYGGSNSFKVDTWWNAVAFNSAAVTLHYSMTNNSCDGSVTVIPPVSTDACGIAATVNDYNGTADASGVYPVGTTTVNWTVTDNNGNTSTCAQNITVIDTTSPQVLANNITVQLDANGSASITASDIDNGSNDACGIASTSIDVSSFSCSDVGANAVVLTVTDNNGNSSSATATVTVEDNIAPVVNCPSDVTASTNTSASVSTYVSGNNTWVYNGFNFNFTDPVPAGKTITGVDITYTVFGYGTAHNRLQLGGAHIGDAFPVSGTQTKTVSYSGSLPNYNYGGTNALNFASWWNSRQFIGATITFHFDNSSATCGVNVTVPAPVVSDACGYAITNDFNGSSDASGYYPVGSTTVNWAITDGNGNSVNCQQLVTVTDNTLPDVQFQNLTVQLDASGSASIAAADIDNGSSDACGIASTSIDVSNFGCSDVGSNPVVLTVTDVNGNSSTATATVTVEDNVAPNAAAQNITVQLDANGSASISASDIDNSSSDACGVASTSIDVSSFGCSEVGSNPVVLTVTDVNGNSSTATATVTVEDNITPNAAAQNITVQLDASGSASITAADIDNGSNDACGVASTSIDVSNFGCSDVGSNPVVLTVTDVNGNSSTATATVTVEDNVAPNAAAQNITVQLNASGSASITAADIDNGSSDACGVASTSIDVSSFSCSDVGSNPVVLTVTDVNGNSSTANASVTVEDNVAPNAAAQNITVQLDANGSASITAADIDNGSNDACGIASTSIDVSSFDCSNIGANPVVLTVTDVNGNTSTANATVTVEDNVAPVAVAQNVTVQLDAQGNGSTTAQAVDAGSTDACGIASLALSQTAFDCSHVGANTVVLTVTDVNGNTSTASATVTVEDNVAPVAVAQNVTVQLDAQGNGSTTAQVVDNGSNDACGIASLALSQTTFDCSHVGANTVVLTVTDVNGNTSTTSATVTVEDNVAPVAVAQNVTVQLDAQGNGSTTAQIVDNGSNDACGIASLALSQTAFDCSHVGANTVVLTVTDVNGNTSTATATVTVEDNVAPVAVAQNVTVQLDAQGNGSTTVAAINNGSNDACGIASLDVSQLNFDCSHVGANTVVLTVIDVNGNISTATTTVDVIATPLVTSVSSPTFNGFNIACNGAATGSIDLTVSQGCAPFSYAWSNGATTEDINGLTAGTYSVTVTDASGTVTASESITLTEPSPLSATASSSGYLSGNGVSGTTLYLGYGPQSINLNTVANGGVSPYSYSWTPAGSLTGASTDSPVASPMATTTYTVTVTDANGCVTTANVTIDVIDARCGKKLNKVLVCHKESKRKRGVVTTNYHNICVSANAVPAHLAHGDYLGPCANGSKNDEGTIAEDFDYHLYPNPTNDVFTVEIHSEVAGDAMFILTDIQGRIIDTQNETTADGITQYQFDLGGYAKGVYMLSIVANNQRFVERVIKQ